MNGRALIADWQRPMSQPFFACAGQTKSASKSTPAPHNTNTSAASESTATSAIANDTSNLTDRSSVWHAELAEHIARSTDEFRALQEAFSFSQPRAKRSTIHSATTAMNTTTAN